MKRVRFSSPSPLAEASSRSFRIACGPVSLNMGEVFDTGSRSSSEVLDTGSISSCGVPPSTPRDPPSKNLDGNSLVSPTGSPRRIGMTTEEAIRHAGRRVKRGGQVAEKGSPTASCIQPSSPVRPSSSALYLGPHVPSMASALVTRRLFDAHQGTPSVSKCSPLSSRPVQGRVGSQRALALVSAAATTTSQVKSSSCRNSPWSPAPPYDPHWPAEGVAPRSASPLLVEGNLLKTFSDETEGVGIINGWDPMLVSGEGGCGGVKVEETVLREDVAKTEEILEKAAPLGYLNKSLINRDTLVDSVECSNSLEFVALGCGDEIDSFWCKRLEECNFGIPSVVASSTEEHLPTSHSLEDSDTIKKKLDLSPTESIALETKGAQSSVSDTQEPSGTPLQPVLLGGVISCEGTTVEFLDERLNQSPEFDTESTTKTCEYNSFWDLFPIFYSPTDDDTVASTSSLKSRTPLAGYADISITSIAGCSGTVSLATPYYGTFGSERKRGPPRMREGAI